MSQETLNNSVEIEAKHTRRNLLLGAGTAAATLAFAQPAMAMNHDDHHDHKHEGHKHDHSKHAPKYPKLLDAVNNCSDKGTRCLSHCLVAWNEGDLQLAACAKKVNEMNAICDGFGKLLSANSNHVKAYAQICRAVCDECADECRKHDQHVECRECAEACENLIEVMDKTFV